MTSSRYALVLLVLAVAAAVVMRLPGLALPLERDEGAYASMSVLWRMGRLPYRDVFDHKPPLLYLLYMPASLLGAPGASTIRLWLLCYFTLQLPLVLVLARRIWEPLTAGLATVLFAIAGSAFSLQGLIFNSEQALVLPAMIALWALYRSIEVEGVGWPLAYGICLGLISLIKPTAVPLLWPLILLSAAPSLRRRMLYLAIAGVGIGLTWLPVLGGWAAFGALRDLGFALITYNRLYAAKSLVQWSAGGVVDMVGPLAGLLLCALAGARLSGWSDTRRRQRLATVLWTGAMFGAALLSLRAYIHYYYPALPGLALLAAPAVTEMAALGRRSYQMGQRMITYVATGLLLAVLVLPFLLDNLRLAHMRPEEQAAALYGRDGRAYFAAAPDAAATIRAVTTPDEEIFVWASEPEIYYLAGRKPAARFIYDYPLQLAPWTREEVVRELRRNPPALYVVYNEYVPVELQALVGAQGFRKIQTVGGYDIWAAPEHAAP